MNTPKELEVVLEKHQLWLKEVAGGQRANLRGASLSGANLSGADLCHANLSGANLRGADLCHANLSGANLSGVNLSGADLRSANLSGVNLSGADLRSASLSGANLSGANLSGADLRVADLRLADLSGAFLRGAIGELVHIKSLSLETYPITYTSDVLQIGCERHALTDWWEFDDEQILKMDGRKAIKFWRKWKEQIKATIELSPAEPTGWKDKKGHLGEDS
jgi:hypothetical protein